MAIKEKTSKDTNWVERLVGGHHFKIHICDAERSIYVERLGRTPEESRERAWDSYGKDRDGSSGGSGK
ncbi:MAG: hypothetical protein HZA00_08455 [Nitrospinae bacterium]|nr:hypothetical protein [Nitrospinota bacterium]